LPFPTSFVANLVNFFGISQGQRNCSGFSGCLKAVLPGLPKGSILTTYSDLPEWADAVEKGRSIRRRSNGTTQGITGKNLSRAFVVTLANLTA